VPGIKANGTSGPVTISNGTSVSIKVSLDPGNRPVKKTDWWVAAQTLFAPPNNWYTYVCPKGWQPGIHVCIQMPPFQILPSFEVLNMALPNGDYTFYFAVDVSPVRKSLIRSPQRICKYFVKMVFVGGKTGFSRLMETRGT
jgi:hypothetical protein